MDSLRELAGLFPEHDAVHRVVAAHDRIRGGSWSNEVARRGMLVGLRTAVVLLAVERGLLSRVDALRFGPGNTRTSGEDGL